MKTLWVVFLRKRIKKNTHTKKTPKHLSISRVKISWVRLCMWGISAKNYELASIVIAKNDFKPHVFFSANWMAFSTLRVWGIAVSPVGTHFPNDLCCHLTNKIWWSLWRYCPGSLEIILFKTPHLAVLIENATRCESATMWHIFGASRRPSERGLTPARWQMTYW